MCITDHVQLREIGVIAAQPESSEAAGSACSMHCLRCPAAGVRAVDAECAEVRTLTSHDGGGTRILGTRSSPCVRRPRGGFTEWVEVESRPLDQAGHDFPRHGRLLFAPRAARSGRAPRRAVGSLAAEGPRSGWRARSPTSAGAARRLFSNHDQQRRLGRAGPGGARARGDGGERGDGGVSPSREPPRGGRDGNAARLKSAAAAAGAAAAGAAADGREGAVRLREWRADGGAAAAAAVLVDPLAAERRPRGRRTRRPAGGADADKGDGLRRRHVAVLHAVRAREALPDRQAVRRRLVREPLHRLRQDPRDHLRPPLGRAAAVRAQLAARRRGGARPRLLEFPRGAGGVEPAAADVPRDAEDQLRGPPRLVHRPAGEVRRHRARRRHAPLRRCPAPSTSPCSSRAIATSPGLGAHAPEGEARGDLLDAQPRRPTSSRTPTPTSKTSTCSGSTIASTSS